MADNLKRVLIRALRTDDIRQVESVLKSGEITQEWIDQSIDTGGQRALHIGAEAGFEEGVFALLEFGANPNVFNDNGETPLHLAAERRFPDLLDLLCMAENAKLEAKRSRDGFTPLHIVAFHGNAECAQILLDNKSNTSCIDMDGNTALMIAVQSSRHSVATKLLSNGANQKIKNKKQQTALSYAMKVTQDKKMIKILVETKSKVATDIDDYNKQKLPFSKPTNKPACNKKTRPHQNLFVTELRAKNKSPTSSQRISFHRDPKPMIGFPRPVEERRKILKSAGVQVDRVEMEPMTQVALQQEDEEDDAYKMSATPRGLCIIINNQDYLCSELKPRAGTDADEKQLEMLFKSLHFHVKVFKNLDAREMYWNIQNYARSDHTDYDCFVCCILAHGTMGAVYGVDGKRQKLCDLTVSLSSTLCPSLAGKPKLFFIQACRGDQAQNGFAINNIEFDAINASESMSAPDHADFLIGYATVAQHIAQRHREKGSVYIQTLCDIIKRDHHRLDLLSMLVKVNNQVSKHVFHNDDGTRFVQMPEVKQTLRKRIMLA